MAHCILVLKFKTTRRNGLYNLKCRISIICFKRVSCKWIMVPWIFAPVCKCNTVPWLRKSTSFTIALQWVSTIGGRRPIWNMPMGSVVVLESKIIKDVLFIAIWCHGTVMLLTFDDLFVKQRRCYSVRCFYACLVMTSKATTCCNYYNTIISIEHQSCPQFQSDNWKPICFQTFEFFCCGVKMPIFYLELLVIKKKRR